MKTNTAQLDFDLAGSRKNRDLGMASTITSNAIWHDQALAMLQPLRGSKREVTGEDVRAWLVANGIDQPQTPHAYGALISHMVRIKMLEDTGRVSRMSLVRSHARRTPVWRFV